MNLVLIRHGESVWNLENRFTGWTDVVLSEQGIQEAHEAGKKLKILGYTFDVAYTSYLQRAQKTLDIILTELSLINIPIFKSYKLNERHYGALQGLNKQETALVYGEDQVKKWRRSISEYPPALTEYDSRYPGNDPVYIDIPKDELPHCENLQMTIDRVVPYYKDIICPQITNNKKVIISAHGNSLRALVKVLDNMTDDEVMDLNIPTGIPLVYELDECLQVIRKHYI